MATSPTPKLETAPEAAAYRSKYSKVTPEYRKAHKNYVLVAALLASWELIGIELNTQDRWGIKLLSPRAVPLILFTLLVYSAYKVIIEWNIEDDPRPKSRRATIDYWISHAIGASAVLIGATQAILKIRIADFVTGHIHRLTSVGVLMALTGWFTLVLAFELKRSKKLVLSSGTLLIVIDCITLFLAVGIRQTLKVNIIISGATLTTNLLTVRRERVVNWFLNRIRKIT